MKINTFSGQGQVFLVIFIGICLLGISPVNGQITGIANDLIVYPVGNSLSTEVTDNSYVLIVGDSNSRISNQEIASAQDRVIGNYKSQRNLRNISVLVTYPCTENTSTLGYGFSIKNRTVYSLTMVVPNDTVVTEDKIGEIRASLKQWYYALPPMGDDDFLQNSDSDNIPYSLDTQYNDDSPYGKLISTLVMKNSGYTNDEKTQYGYIGAESFGITPGMNAYTSSHWEVNTFEAKEDYTISELPSTVGWEWQPSGDKYGSESVGVSVGLPKGISASWTFHQEEYSRHDSSNMPSYANWKWTANTAGAKTASTNVQPGSSGYFTIPSVAKTYKFFGVREKAQFCNYGACGGSSQHDTPLNYDAVVVVQ